MERNANRDLSETERRAANGSRMGTIAEVDYVRCRARVRSGDVLTGWLPWTTERAQGDRTWSAPEVGEQVLVVAPGGDLAQGVISGRVYRAAEKGAAPADKPTVRRTVYDDGTVEEYDREAHKHLLDLRAADGEARVLTGAAEVIVKPDTVEFRVGGSEIIIVDGNITIRADRIDLNP